MAIDDNTSYELTGAQVKDLANKIKGKAADNTFVGATPAAPGSKGLVPEPQAGDNAKFLSGDGTWQTPPTVNNGALTIQQNGTTLDTFTANSSDDKTVNIQTITAETVAPAEEVGAITTNMIADRAVTSAKVDWDTFRTGTPQLLGWSVSSGTFTAPSLGLVIVQTASAANATCSLAINGKTVGRVQGGASAFTWAPMTILVSKGDVVNGTTSDNGGNAQLVPSGCLFIPLGS